jgi:lysophospholipase L1-like esterase
MTSPLPTNIDQTYADSGTDPSVAAHQKQHDALHGLYNSEYRRVPTSPGLTLRPGFVPVGSDPAFPQNNIPDTSNFSRYWIPLARDLDLVSLAFINYDTSAVVGGYPTEYQQTMDVRYAVGIENAAGTSTVTLTANGLALFPVSPGATVWTDPIDIGLPVSDGGFFVRVYAERNTGTGTLPTPHRCTAEYTDGQQQTNGTNQTAGTGPITTGFAGAGLCPGPVVIANKAKPFDDQILAVTGDSIVAGEGDVSNTRGFLSRACTTNKVRHIRIARGSERATEFGGDRSRTRRRLALIAGCTDAICGYGTNDMASGLTGAQTQTALVALWKMLAARGMRVSQTTILPRTNSTNGWQTVASQTMQTGMTDRVAVNTWIRAGAPLDSTTLQPVAVGTSGALLAGQAKHPLVGYVEMADAVESARNSGAWGTPPVIATVSTTNASTSVTVTTATTGTFAAGDHINGTGIPAGTWVRSVAGNVLTLSAAATATATGVTAYSPLTSDGTHPASRGHAVLAASSGIVTYLQSLQ